MALPVSAPDPPDAGRPVADAPDRHDGRAAAHPGQGETSALLREDAVLVRLGQMPAELAAPLLQASLPALTPPVLLALIMVTGETHHRLIAARPNLDARVVKALLRTGRDSVIRALLDNATLTFDAADKSLILSRAAGNPDIAHAIAGRPDTFQPSGLINSASQDLLPPADSALAQANLRLLARLRGGSTGGFTREAARRLSLDAEGLWRALHGGSCVPLALLACALGFDRAAFVRVLEPWQKVHGGPPLSAARKPLILSVFDLMPSEALRRLRARL